MDLLRPARRLFGPVTRARAKKPICLPWQSQSRSRGRQPRRPVLEQLEDRTLLATVTWINSVGGDWNTGTNWDNGVGPGIGDDAVIPDLSGTPTITHSSGSHTIASLTSNENLTISDGSVTVNGNVTLNGNFTLSGGTLTVNGTHTVSGATMWSGGTMSGTGTTRTEGTLSLTANSTLTMSSRTLTVAAGATLSGANNLNFSNSSVLNILAGSTFDITNDNDLVELQPGTGATSTINNQGTLKKSTTGGLTDVSVRFNNTGLADFQTGQLRFSGGGTSTGSFTVPTGLTLGFAGGTHNLNTGASVAGAGAVVFSEGTVNFNGGTYNITTSTQATGGTANFNSGVTVSNVGPLTVTSGALNFSNAETIVSPTSLTISGGTLNLSTGGPINTTTLSLSGGTLDGTDTVTVSGATTWSAGSMSGTGTTRTEGTLSLTANSTLTMSSRTLTVVAGATLSGANNLNFSNSSVLNLLAGSTIDITNDNDLVELQPGTGVTSTINNQGTLKKSTTGGLTDVSVRTNNTGTVEEKTGTLQFSGTVPQHSGSTLTGGTWIVNNATLTFSSGSDITTNQGSVTLNGASSTFSKINNFTSNQGTFSLQNGRTFITSADFTNTGTLNIDTTSKLQSGLAGQVSLWSGEGNASDSVDGNNGTLQPVGNPPTFPTGRVGQAFSFDGTNDHVLVADSASLRPTSLTLGGWFKFNSTTGTQLLIDKHLGDGFLDSYEIWTDTGTLNGLISDASGFGPFLTAPFSPTLGVWYHLAYTFDDATDTQRLFINGTQVASGSVTKSIGYDGDALLLGASGDADPPNFPFSGMMDEASIFSRALSAGEIASLASGDTVTQTAGTTNLGTGGILHGGIEVQGGSLVGSGTVRGDVVNSGTVAPGNSPGCITVNGNYDQSSAGNLNIEIAGTSPGTGCDSSSQFDRLVVNGTVSLGGTLTRSLINNFIPATGNSFKIIDNDGTDAVNGTFQGLAEGATFALGIVTIQISYVGGTGNDVVLTVTQGFNKFWDGGAGTLNWNDAANWSGDTLPIATDDVYLDIAGTNTVTLASGTHTISRLNSNESLTISGGTLQVNGPLSITGTFTMSGQSHLQNAALAAGTTLTINSAFLNGVTTTANSEIVLNGDLTILNGITIGGRVTVNSNRALIASGSQTWGGGGEIVMDGNAGIFIGPANTTLTIGSGLTIHGTGGINPLNLAANTSLINNGTIAADVPGSLGIVPGSFTNNSNLLVTHSAATLNVLPGTWTNQSPITVSTGTFTINPAGWSNQNTITLTGGTINFGGTFTLADLGTFTRTGGTAGTVNLIGTLTNTGTTLLLDTANIGYGTWKFANNNSSIVGGTIETRNGAVLEAVGNSTLDAVTLAANSDIVINGQISTLNGFTNNGKVTVNTDRALLTSGTQTWGGSGDIQMVGNAGIFISPANTTLTIGSGLTIHGTGGINPLNLAANTSLINNGTIAADVPSGNFGLAMPNFTNVGTVQASSGVLNSTAVTPTNFSGGTLTGGTWKATSGGTLRVGVPSAMTTNAATIVVDGATSNFFRDVGTTKALTSLTTIAAPGSLAIQNGHNLTTPSGLSNSGTISVGTGSTLTPGGTLTVQSGGTLKGNGTVAGPIANSGSVAPGNSPGCITVNGNYDQSSAGNLNIEIAGTSPGTGCDSSSQFDRLVVNGTVSLDGTLNVSLIDPFTPAVGDTFTIIDNDDTEAVTGTFSNIVGNTFTVDGTKFLISYAGGDGNDVVLTVLQPSCTIAVTSTNDSGADSLRTAITAANAAPDMDEICFVIDGLAPHTISLDSELPTITEPLMIDGWSEPDFAGTPVIEIDGNSAGADVTGLTITAADSTIRGLIINRFDGNGILISGPGATGNVIIGNYIGTDVDGEFSRGNQGHGVEIINAPGNQIGTDGDGTSDPLERNIISGNSQYGIFSQGKQTIIVGNYIGTDITGTAAVGNGVGVSFQGSGANRVGTNADGMSDEEERNVISGNFFSGLELFDGGNVVAGNFIGTDRTGMPNLGNGGDGSVHTILNLAAGVTTFSGISHRYLDDGLYTIRAEVGDDEQPVEPITTTRMIVVLNETL